MDQGGDGEPQKKAMTFIKKGSMTQTNIVTDHCLNARPAEAHMYHRFQIYL